MNNEYKKNKKSKKKDILRAVFTVEAAIYVPMFIFAMAKGMLKSMEYYTEVKEAAAVTSELTCPNQIDIILKTKAVKKGVEILSGDTISAKP